MAIFSCEFSGNRRLPRIRYAKNKTECQVSLYLDGITKYRITELTNLGVVGNVLFANNSKIKKTTICDFFEQLSFLLRAGVPMYNALESIGKTGDKEIKRLCISIIPMIVEGLSFDEALRRSSLFSLDVIHQIRAGVESGDLPKSLDRVSEMLRKQQEAKRKIISASIYPTFMLLVLIAVVILLMTTIIPKISATFESLGGELPALTVFIVNLSNWFVANIFKLISIIVTFVVILYFFLKYNENAKEIFDMILLKVPIFGGLILKRTMGSISLILASLLMCGVPMVQSISITAETVKNVYLRRALIKVKKYVEIEGNSLYTALLQVNVFPKMFMQLVDVGERSGDIVTVLDKLSERYDTEVDTIVKRLLTLMEPVVILLMVGVGGTVVLAMMMPMFSIINIL